MSRGRFTEPGRFARNKKSVRERLEQGETARKELVERHRKIVADRAAQIQAEEERKAARPQRNTERYCHTLSSIPFWMSGEHDPWHVAKPYLDLVRLAVSNMNAETRQAVLCWPNFHPSAAAIAMLLSLADNGSTDAVHEGGLGSLAAPVGVRALIFPYANTAHRGLRHLYVDHAYLGKLHTLHQVRAMARGDDDALADYHKTIARVKTLTGVALDGRHYDEFLHPCLDELMPAGPCGGHEEGKDLLWRVWAKTDIRKISRTGKADDPQTAKFYLFGLRANDDIGRGLDKLAGKLDLLICDLTATGRNRLGRDWQERARTFLATAERRLGPVACIALTDDPWTYDTLRFDTLSRLPRSKESRRPEAGTVLLSHGSDLVLQKQGQEFACVGLSRAEAIGFSGDIETIIQRVRGATLNAADLRDREAADLLRRLQGAVRRCASLPGSQTQFSDYLESQVGGAAAADIMSAYRVGALVKALKQSQGPWSQHARQELDQVSDEIARIWENTAKLTPMAPLLRDVVRRF